jgi:hypothetical protein
MTEAQGENITFQLSVLASIFPVEMAGKEERSRFWLSTVMQVNAEKADQTKQSHSAHRHDVPKSASPEQQ